MSRVKETNEEMSIESFLKEKRFKEFERKYSENNFKEPPMIRRLRISIGKQGYIRIYDIDKNEMLVDEWMETGSKMQRRVAEITISIVADKNKEGEKKVLQLLDLIKDLYQNKKEIFYAT